MRKISEKDINVINRNKITIILTMYETLYDENKKKFTLVSRLNDSFFYRFPFFS